MAFKNLHHILFLANFVFVALFHPGASQDDEEMIAAAMALGETIKATICGDEEIKKDLALCAMAVPNKFWSAIGECFDTLSEEVTQEQIVKEIEAACDPNAQPDTDEAMKFVQCLEQKEDQLKEIGRGVDPEEADQMTEACMPLVTTFIKEKWVDEIRKLYEQKRG